MVTLLEIPIPPYMQSTLGKYVADRHLQWCKKHCEDTVRVKSDCANYVTSYTLEFEYAPDAVLYQLTCDKYQMSREGAHAWADRDKP